MKRFSIFQYIVLIVVLIFAGWLPVMAQQNKNEALNGRVIDKSTAEPMPNTTLQLYEITTRRNRTDTTFV